MCDNTNNTCENCIADILKVILLLQKNSCGGDVCLQTCDKGFLGDNTNLSLNTRPVELYLFANNGTPLAMPTSRDPEVTDTSEVFRVEKLDNCCATFRVLAPNTDPTSTLPYVTTNSFFTINLNCVCIIRCLEDTYVEGI